MGKVSISVKMTLWYCLLTTILLLIFLPLLYNFIASTAQTNLENDLREEANRLVSDREVLSSSELDFEHSHEFAILIFDSSNALLASNTRDRSLRNPNFEFSEMYEQKTRDTTFLVYDFTKVEKGKTYTIRIAKSKQTIETLLANTKMIMWIGAPLFLLFALISGLMIAKRTLRPVVRIAEAAKQVENGDLSIRIQGIETKDEVGTLATSFNSMVEHLEIAFQREQKFASDASHELRTPVAIIMNHTEQLLRGSNTNKEDEKEAYQTILNETKRMNKIIAQLLALTRGYEGKYSLEMENVNLNAMVENVLDQLQDYANQSGIILKYPKKEDLYIMVDQSLWTQLCLNIIENAIKYGKEGGMVEVRTYKHQEDVVMEVIDNGLGIKEDALPFIFERFYRQDSSRDRTGTGLGLSIVKWIVSIHHAKIHVDSKLNEGTSVIIRIPQAKK